LIHEQQWAGRFQRISFTDLENRIFDVIEGYPKSKKGLFFEKLTKERLLCIENHAVSRLNLMISAVSGQGVSSL